MTHSIFVVRMLLQRRDLFCKWLLYYVIKKIYQVGVFFASCYDIEKARMPHSMKYPSLFRCYQSISIC